MISVLPVGFEFDGELRSMAVKSETEFEGSTATGTTDLFLSRDHPPSNSSLHISM